VLLMIALVALGVWALRRQVAVEFPDASVSGAQASWQERVEHARVAMRERLSRAREHAPRLGASPSAVGNGAGPGIGSASAAASPAERIALLERLAALHAQGVLSDQELAAEKAALLHAGEPR